MPVPPVKIYQTALEDEVILSAWLGKIFQVSGHHENEYWCRSRHALKFLLKG